MNENKDFSRAEALLGYTFRDKSLLKTCFTHSSYASEHGVESNERLEFLGDALLGFLVADALYRAGGESEGEMTSRRSRFVSREPLEKAVSSLGLQKFLLVSASMKNGTGKKAVSSLFEAVVAGIYLDGGIGAAEKFVRENLSLRESRTENDKGKLQEYLQAHRQPLPEYAVIAREGADNAPLFTVEVRAAENRAQGTGKSVREAEKAAAKKLLAILNKGE